MNFVKHVMGQIQMSVYHAQRATSIHNLSESATINVLLDSLLLINSVMYAMNLVSLAMVHKLLIVLDVRLDSTSI